MGLRQINQLPSVSFKFQLVKILTTTHSQGHLLVEGKGVNPENKKFQGFFFLMAFRVSLN